MMSICNGKCCQGSQVIKQVIYQFNIIVFDANL